MLWSIRAGRGALQSQLGSQVGTSECMKTPANCTFLIGQVNKLDSHSRSSSTSQTDPQLIPGEGSLSRDQPAQEVSFSGVQISITLHTIGGITFGTMIRSLSAGDSTILVGIAVQSPSKAWVRVHHQSPACPLGGISKIVSCSFPVWEWSSY